MPNSFYLTTNNNIDYIDLILNDIPQGFVLLYSNEIDEDYISGNDKYIILLDLENAIKDKILDNFECYNPSNILHQEYCVKIDKFEDELEPVEIYMEDERYKRMIKKLDTFMSYEISSKYTKPEIIKLFIKKYFNRNDVFIDNQLGGNVYVPPEKLDDYSYGVHHPKEKLLTGAEYCNLFEKYPDWEPLGFFPEPV